MIESVQLDKEHLMIRGEEYESDDKVDLKRLSLGAVHCPGPPSTPSTP